MNIAVLFGALSVYHVARVRCAARIFHEADCPFTLTVIERVGQQEDYPWFGGLKPEDLIVRKAYDSEQPTPDTRLSAARLCKVLDEVQPDVVAFGLSSPAYLAVLQWCVRSHRPAVLFCTNLDYATRRPWKEAIKKLVYQLFSTALGGGTAHKRYIMKLGLTEDQIYLGYNAVDNGHFSDRAGMARNNRCELRHCLELQSKYFLCSCRFIPEKNLERLLAAYARYRSLARDQAWQFVLIGDGHLRPRLEVLSTELMLPPESLVTPGLIPYEQICDYYGLASAFVLPSVSETWGLVVNEAMASGLPVIVSRRCGCALDLVRDGENGFLIDPFDVEDIAAKMLHMASLPDSERQAMGRRSQEIIAEWGPERFACGLKAAVEKALEIGPKKPSITDRVLLRALTLRS